jgi:hypothetical protein
LNSLEKEGENNNNKKKEEVARPMILMEWRTPAKGLRFSQIICPNLKKFRQERQLIKLTWPNKNWVIQPVAKPGFRLRGVNFFFFFNNE